MRTMVVDGGVHPDVINKLWQVYSELDSVLNPTLTPPGTDQEIPKPQRQGAIIILGMLAIAKREVVSERVESLLRIGLGSYGMVGGPVPGIAKLKIFRTTLYWRDTPVSLCRGSAGVPRRSKVGDARCCSV